MPSKGLQSCLFSLFVDGSDVVHIALLFSFSFWIIRFWTHFDLEFCLDFCLFLFNYIHQEPSRVVFPFFNGHLPFPFLVYDWSLISSTNSFSFLIWDDRSCYWWFSRNKMNWRRKIWSRSPMKRKRNSIEHREHFALLHILSINPNTAELMMMRKKQKDEYNMAGIGSLIEPTSWNLQALSLCLCAFRSSGHQNHPVILFSLPMHKVCLFCSFLFHFFTWIFSLFPS